MVPAPLGSPLGTVVLYGSLFADLRGFTQIAERRLPYDVVFQLSQYVATVGGAITRSGGLDVLAFPRHEATVGNRQEPLAIRVILDTGALAPPASFPPTARRVRSASD